MAAGKGTPLSPSAEHRQRLGEPEQSPHCKPVLLEKTSHLGSEVAKGQSGQDVACAEPAMSTWPGQPGLDKPLPQETGGEQRQRAFTELPWPHGGLRGGLAQEWEHGDPSVHPGPQQWTLDVPRSPASSTVCSEWLGAAQGGGRSAFSKPTKRPAERPGPTFIFQGTASADTLGELSGLLSTLDSPFWGQLAASKLVVGDFWNVQTLSQNALFCHAFHSAPTLWLERTQVPTPSASCTTSWALLPPTLTSLGLSTQNWCAKCSLSFRLTSDLVFHMRSHHKKEHTGPEPPSKKHREGALTCPVCHEHFRERHHLSRHMTSHS